MFPLHTLASLLPEGGRALAAGLHPELLRAWLETLREKPPEQAATALRARLQRLAGTNGLQLRLTILDLMAGETLRLTAAFEARLDKARHPLSDEDRRAVVAGNALLKQHAACYHAVADRLQGGWIGRGRAGLLRHALVAAMEMERRRLILAYRAYAPGSPSAWRGLHRLYRLARAEGLAMPAAADADSPHRLYVKSLLLALAGPVQLAPGELDRVRFYLERHADLAELHPLTQARLGHTAREGAFLIRLNEDGPGRSLRKWHGLELHPGDLLLDCGPLLKKMRSQTDALEHGALPSRIGLPIVARRPQYLAMMKNLLAQWGDPPGRRFPRQHFRPRVELAVGLDDLWLLLSGAAPRRRRDDRGGAGGAVPPIALGEWTVANESPTGFALQYLSGDSGALAVGALVGVRSAERSQVQICRVRRLVSGERRRAELGLEKYAPFAVPTLIAWSGSAAASRPPARAIVLPRVPALGGRGAVIVAPQVLRTGKRVPFEMEGRRLTHVAGVPLERCGACEIFALNDPESEP